MSDPLDAVRQKYREDVARVNAIPGFTAWHSAACPGLCSGSHPCGGVGKWGEGTSHFLIAGSPKAWVGKSCEEVFTALSTPPVSAPPDRGPLTAAICRECSDEGKVTIKGYLNSAGVVLPASAVDSRLKGCGHPKSEERIDDGRVTRISVTPRSPDAETIGKARAMEEFLNSEAARQAMDDAKKAIADTLPCGCSAVRVAVAGHHGSDRCKPPVPFGPELPKTTEFVARRAKCCEGDDGIAGHIHRCTRKPNPWLYSASTFSGVPSFLDDKVTWKVRLGGLASTPKVSPDPYAEILLPRDTVAYERLVTQRQADADNHSGKPFTVGPGLALRETVRGCRRCRIRRFGSACNGCGDPVTSFELRPNESGW